MDKADVEQQVKLQTKIIITRLEIINNTDFGNMFGNFLQVFGGPGGVRRDPRVFGGSMALFGCIFNIRPT